jgi:hypothetical protein
MKRHRLIGALLACALLPGVATAEIGALDPVPGATLLIPYFEVDLADAQGPTTSFVVQNAAAAPVVTHVTLWSDLGVPVFGFNLALAARGRQTVSLRDVLTGTLPQTRSSAAGCATLLPPAAPSANALESIQHALSGQAASGFGNKCVSAVHGDALLRGYVTVDVVNACSAKLPNAAGYFAAGGTGIASDANALQGSFALLDPAKKRAQSLAAVSLEASATDARTSAPGAYTFYAGLTGFSAADNREALATQWIAPYDSTQADLVVWRDAKGAVAPFACGTLPSPFPLSTEDLLSFDDQEQALNLNDGTDPLEGAGATVPTLAANRLPLGGTEGLPVMPKGGFLYLSLNTTQSPSGLPAADPTVSQAYVFTLAYPEAHGDEAPFATALPATPLDSASLPRHHIF